MADVYEPEEDYDDTNLEEELETSARIRKREQSIGDVYDLYDMATNVHSPVPEITRDFTLSHLSENVIHHKLAKFIREQIKTMRVFKSFLLIPEAALTERYLHRYDSKEEAQAKAKEVYTDIQAVTEDISGLVLSEIYTMVIMSRSLKGEIIKAMLTQGRTREEVMEFEEAVDGFKQPTTKEKLLEKRPPQQT